MRLEEPQKRCAYGAKECIPAVAVVQSNRGSLDHRKLHQVSDDLTSIQTSSLALIWLRRPVIKKVSNGIFKFLCLGSRLQDISISPLRARIPPPVFPARAPCPWGSSVSPTLEDLFINHVQHRVIFLELSSKSSSTLSHLIIIRDIEEVGFHFGGSVPDHVS